MPIAESYTVKPDTVSDYFDAIHAAQAPERFSQRFLEQLGFSSTNDRAFIGVLKDLKFLDQDGKPTEVYFRFLDRENSAKILAQQIRLAYQDLFAINKKANTMSKEEIKNKLKVIFKGSKSDNLLNRMATTFISLCALADFEATSTQDLKGNDDSDESKTDNPDLNDEALDEDEHTPDQNTPDTQKPAGSAMKVSGLQYHINIVLPESRDQMVYDAIFKSLRDHLG